MQLNKRFYINSLDGIRAVAAMMVFISHAGLPNLVPGGFGVTIFFFLSGYLVTTLLRNEYEKSGAINLKKFYLRRIYRIFPPMYLVLCLIATSVFVGVLKSDMHLNAVLAQVFHLTNYYVIVFGSKNLVPDTVSYWSLAIEEHFYLLFPLLFLFFIRRWSYKGIAKLLFSMCLAVLVWRVVLVYELNASQQRTYMATDTRFDSLLFGCIMGVWANPIFSSDYKPFRERYIKIITLMCAIGLLIFTFIFRDEFFRETIRYTLQGVALFPIFWLAVDCHDWLIFRWLNWKPVSLFGMVSYVFYLSHLYWLHVGNILLKGIKAGFLGFGLALIFSVLVYWLVEYPFSKLRRVLH